MRPAPQRRQPSSFDRLCAIIDTANAWFAIVCLGAITAGLFAAAFLTGYFIVPLVALLIRPIVFPLFCSALFKKEITCEPSRRLRRPALAPPAARPSASAGVARPASHQPGYAALAETPLAEQPTVMMHRI